MGLSNRARSIGPGSQVSIGHIQHGGFWDPRPEAMRRLLWETGKRTSIDVRRDADPLALEDEQLFRFPLLFLTGSGSFPAFSTHARSQLGRHLRYGGLLYIDFSSPDDLFHKSVSRELHAILPQKKLRKLNPEHVLYKSFFLLDRVVGRTGSEPWLYGLDIHKRTAVVMTKCDVLGALERDKLGSWTFECIPGGQAQREQAIRFGINLMMYALCLDYKTDQVHIPFIMKKKRR
jgi:hypothetical protein